MERLLAWWPITLLGILVALVLGGLLLKFPPNDASTTASWVQAIGSILAIAGTGAFVLWQHHLTVKATNLAESQRCKTRLEGLRRLVLATANVAEKIAIRTGPNSNEISSVELYSMCGELHAIKWALEAIEAHELEHWAQTEAAVVTLGSVTSMEQILKLHGPRTTEPLPRAIIRDCMNEYRAHLIARQALLVQHLQGNFISL